MPFQICVEFGANLTQNSTFFNVALFGMNDGRRSLPMYEVRGTIRKIQRAELAGGGELGIFMALVAVLDRTVVDDFDAEGNELLTGHDEPWVVEFAAKSDDLCQEPG